MIKGRERKKITKTKAKGDAEVTKKTKRGEQNKKKVER